MARCCRAWRSDEFPGRRVWRSDHERGDRSHARAGKTVTGHFPAEDDRMLQAYMATGVSSDHETVTREQALEKVRLGMHLMIREGSAWQDVKEVVKVITEDKVRTDNISLVTDDVYPQTLRLGHMNHVVRRAMEEGVDRLRRSSWERSTSLVISGWTWSLAAFHLAKRRIFC